MDESGYRNRLLREFFFNRLSELDEEQRRLELAIRTKRGVLQLCDDLRAVTIEKQVVYQLFEILQNMI